MKGGEANETLLSLAAKGNYLLSEISQLSQSIPDIFRECRGDESMLLFDFSYFKSADAIEESIEKNERLEALDAQLKEEYVEELTRFYQCFESIERYGSDLIQFVDDLKEGKFIQQTLDSVLQDQDGRQLLAETVFLLGFHLIFLDTSISGPVRERLMVSYYRYRGEAGYSSTIDTVCQILRSTGYVPGGKRPPNYPENLLARVPIQQELIIQLVGRLRSEDLYNTLQYYPNPTERSTAQCVQSSMLYIILFFSPNILKQETALMREIVDKFYSDNWVISIYMGLMVWLPDSWEPYKAAKAAISNTTSNTHIREVSLAKGKTATEISARIEGFLTEGVITKSNLLENIPQLLTAVRESNVCLRWLLLHTGQLQDTAAFHKRTRQLFELTARESGVTVAGQLHLLVSTARLEQNIRQLYSSLLEERAAHWDHLKQEASSRLEELADVFSGQHNLSRIQPNKNLEKWLRQRGKQISQLDIDQPDTTGHLVVQLAKALDDAQDFHQLGANLQVTQYLSETKASLLSMLRLTGAREDILVQLQIIADISYGWKLVHNFTGLMQNQIKRDPNIVADLRCVFIKLSGAMEGAMMRLSQAESRNLLKVSRHYSTTLVQYIRTVLQVIPDTMFGLLEQIIRLQTGMEDLPTRLEKGKLKELAQLEKRFQIAQITHQVSVLSCGILALRRTLVGVVQVDPKRLLEEGIRCELVSRVTKTLHTTLTLNTRSKDRVGDLKRKLSVVKTAMESFRKSFEYIQDYINIPGLSLWQEEISRIVNFAVEREAAVFLRGNVQSYSQYQSTVAPIPEFPPQAEDLQSRNFIGRLARELVSVTEASSGLFVPGAGAWFMPRPPHTETIGWSIVFELYSGLGVPGLTGLSRLLGLMAVTVLQKNLATLNSELQEDTEVGKMLKQAENALGPVGGNGMVANPSKTYAGLASKLTRSFQVFGQMINQLGQITTLRKLFSSFLSSSSMFDSKLLRASLNSLQYSIITSAVQPGATFPPDEGESELLSELGLHLHWVGLDDPEHQIYVPSPSLPQRLELFLALFVLSYTPRLVFSPNTGSLVSKRVGETDGSMLMTGLAVFLNHYHPKVRENVVLLLEQAGESFTLAAETAEAGIIKIFTHSLCR